LADESIEGRRAVSVGREVHEQTLALVGELHRLEGERHVAELKVATVRSQVVLTLGDDFRDYTTFAPRPHQEQALDAMPDDLVAWGGALRQLRAPAEELPVSAA